MNLNEVLYIKKEIICDISNIACFNKRNQNSKLRYIDILFSTFPEDIEIIGIADFTLFYQIDERKRYKKEYLVSKRIIEAPVGIKADVYILNYALENGTFILSNDKFKEYDWVPKEWLNTHRISFMFINEQLILQFPGEVKLKKLLGEVKINPLEINTAVKNHQIEV